MMKRKNKIIVFSFLMLFFIVQPIFISTSFAQIVNIWGISEGATRSYDYYEIYSGSINSITTHPRRTYRIVKIYDNDGNNYTELIFQITTTNIYGSPQVSTQVLDDSSSSWSYNGLEMTSSNYYMSNPLYPIYYNGTDSIGFNWTAAEVHFNTADPNWNMTISGNIATLNRSYNGTENGADYDVNIIIKWNIVSGWLISYDEIKTYNETLGYSIHYQTTIALPTAGFLLDWSILFSTFAIGLGAAAVVFATLAYKKFK
ncbi:MAG: hypothetical protein ACTSUG_10570 [Candidatus Helarchaeota archaeon]